MKFREQLTKYFKVFSNKDIDTLSAMFADEVLLVDWNVFASGKEKVIEANKNIFDSVSSIKVTPIEFYSNSDTSYAVKIFIVVNDNEKLDVIDVINFNENGLVTSIVAFKNEN